MTTGTSARDPNTLSNYDEFLTKHVTANLDIDFTKERLKGNVTLDVEVLQRSDKVILDTSYLDVSDIKVNSFDVKWTLASRTEPYGSALKIHLGSDTDVGKRLSISVVLLLALRLG